MRRALLPALCGVALVAGAAAPNAVNLSQRDRAQVVAAACGSGAADELRAHAAAKGTGAITVEVSCKPHAQLGKLPLFRHRTCRNAAGAWRCDTNLAAVRMSLPDARQLPVIADGVTPELAIEIITEGTKLQVPPFHHPAILLMRGQCRVAPHPTSPAPDMKRFDITCDDSSMLLTKHCWNGGCRYFIAEGTGY